MEDCEGSENFLLHRRRDELQHRKSSSVPQWPRGGIGSGRENYYLELIMIA